MEADVSGGWTKSPVMTCSSLSLCVSVSVCLSVSKRRHLYSALPNIHAPWFTQRRSGERRERRDFLPRICFLGSYWLSAIMEMAVLWTVRTGLVVERNRVSVMYRRMQVDHSVIFDSLTLQLLQSTKYCWVGYCICTANWWTGTRKQNKTYQSRLCRYSVGPLSLIPYSLRNYFASYCYLSIDIPSACGLPRWFYPK